MNKTVAEGARHLIINLRDYVAGAFCNGKRGIDADAEAAESVRVGRGERQQSDIDGHSAAFEQFFDLAQVNGSVVSAAVVNGLTDVTAYKHSVMAEVPCHLASHVGGRTHGHHVDDFYVLYVGSATHQRFDQSLRFGASWLNVHTHPRAHAEQRFLWRL